MALLTLGTLAVDTARAAGLLNQPVAVQGTPFCEMNRCEAAGRRPIAGSIWESVYVTAPAEAGVGPQLQVYASQGRVVGAALNFAGPQPPFAPQDYRQPGTPAQLAADFTALLLGQQPTYRLLEEWQASCDSGQRLNFAGARLTCSRLGLAPGLETLTFHIGQ
ncbi:hypothetical protein GCM10017783_04150 [Deinococcus piscis]|uniref:Uncharacterized protein n=1 Tax=Deinococcus piscis TaxID=394230 RepID=A0ABQ3JY66_9DEIO|nr:hypothetical protein GCM10017783_04150 [Deinococcus piscis]